MDSKKEKEVSDIIQYYNRQVSNIFKIIDGGEYNTFQDNPDIDWIRRMVKLVRNENPPYMLEQSLDKLWEHREAIINKDYKFFMVTNIPINAADTNQQAWMDGLIDFIRIRYGDLSEDDAENIWKYINNMLQAVIKYRIIRCDFK
jgi:hypothetical protein